MTRSDDTGEMVTIGDVLDEAGEARRAAAESAVSELLSSDRAPPAALDAERALLGGILLRPDAIHECEDIGLRPGDFYRHQHGRIYAAVLSLARAGDAVDTVTVTERLAERGDLASVGGAEAVAVLEGVIPTAAHVPAYAALVRDKAIARRLLEVSAVLSADIRSGSVPAGVAAETAQASISEATAALARGDGLRPIGEYVGDAVTLIEAAHSQPDHLPSVRRGLRALDDVTLGAPLGELMILAARPSMGKTAFALDWAIEAAQRGDAAAVFSLEMSGASVAMRSIARRSGLDLHDLRRGRIAPTGWQSLQGAVGALSSLPLYIDQTAAISTSYLRHRLRRHVREHGVRLAVVDYLQLMTPSRTLGNKATEVGEISRDLKAIASDLGIAVVALSQLNRSVESRTDRRPMMSDLRESGAIEQDADAIVFLYRDDYYLREKCPDSLRGIAEVIVAKQRNGPIGVRYARFDSRRATFHDLDDADPFWTSTGER